MRLRANRDGPRLIGIILIVIVCLFFFFSFSLNGNYCVLSTRPEVTERNSMTIRVGVLNLRIGGKKNNDRMEETYLLRYIFFSYRLIYAG